MLEVPLDAWPVVERPNCREEDRSNIQFFNTPSDTISNFFVSDASPSNGLDPKPSIIWGSSIMLILL